MGSVSIMSRASERILVIYNPSSGVVSKDLATSLIFKRLRRYFNTVSIVNTNSPEHAQELTRQGMEHYDVITAFGGDGTINSVATAMVGSDKVLGVLPGGSGNGLVRNLGIPLSWRRALDVLIYGEDIRIDAGKINQHLFFNVAGMGLDGFISKKFNEESASRGILPYVYYAIRGYFEMPDFRVRITLDDTEFDDQILLIAFANFRQYGGNAIIAPHALPSDGQLDLCVLNPFRLLKSSLTIQRLFTGNIDKFPFYKTFRFEQVRVRSLSGPIPYTFDGEACVEELTEFDVSVIPACLKVRRPVPGSGT